MSEASLLPLLAQDQQGTSPSDPQRRPVIPNFRWDPVSARNGEDIHTNSISELIGLVAKVIPTLITHSAAARPAYQEKHPMLWKHQEMVQDDSE